MFDIGFGELLLVGLVALLVLGPERLPAAARTAGQWMGKAKRMAQAIQLQVEEEVGANQLQQSLQSPLLLEKEQALRQGIVTTAPAAATPVPLGPSKP
ncbi:Sec-independent protein translocase protein TatB [Pseudomonas sp. R5(2019)]|uniref:Sec-independent protein translocase protein TatB n=1 Tax=Pseudomonas sp. R5(2019) TaxID=2697566 RepID=UPI001411FDE5|nr:Sec-independent protein translocase protein TatB [Pseudomonas sp. R5(2019)]NBA98013.1 twin-arginine translocase subunit TatB [Pseudomonas sp. R5(2019)]